MHATLRTRPSRRLNLLSWACLAALGMPAAQAAITTTGAVNPNVPIGPGDTDLGTTQVYFGGTLRVDGGSRFTLGGMTFAPNAADVSSGVIHGAGSRVDLIGPGNRLEIGNWGNGELTVSGGAVLDARRLTFPAVDCGGCVSFIGNAAGSTGTLNVDGPGSFVNLWALTVGGAAVFGQPNPFGTPGGFTRGAVNITAGASMQSVVTTIGAGPGGSNPLGTERTFASVQISGAGSNWRVTSNLSNGVDAFMGLAGHANATARMVIDSGGSLLLDAVPGRVSNFVVGQFGVADLSVSGPGSNITFAEGATGVLQIGRNASAVGRMSVANGAVVAGMYYTSIGRDGGVGVLTVDGAGSLYRMNGNSTLASQGSPFVAFLDVGRNGGNGQLHVRNGGRVEIDATTARTNGPSLNIGRDAGSTGTVTISGAGSAIELRAASVAPGNGEAFNPFVRIGRQGNGAVTISGGGRLLLEGNAVSSPTASRSTSLYVGGAGDTVAGGFGSLSVTGAGSEVRMSGSDAFLAVGIGAGSVGQMTVADQAQVHGMIINVGRSGGTGVLQVNGAQVHLSGQQTGNNLAGAGVSVGNGGGTGAMHLSNGALVRIDNASGSTGTGFNIGGSGFFPGGNGTVTMSGGSRIEVVAPAGLGGANIGRSGVGVMQMTDSHVDLGAGSNTSVGRDADGIGTLVLNGSSSFVSGFVGIGRRLNADQTTVDGGIGTVVVNAGSSLTADDIVIGSKGFLGGTGTINGNVTNYGVLGPGNSPGTLTINGNFSAQQGSRLVLEVESDGQGGFNTDKLIFSDSATVDLSGLNIEFRFIGSLNPLDYQSVVGLDIDDFIQRQGGDALPDAFYGGSVFTASAESVTITYFSYTPDGGAVIAVVPEPQTWALMGLGLAGLAWRSRRRAA